MWQIGRGLIKQNKANGDQIFWFVMKEGKAYQLAHDGPTTKSLLAQGRERLNLICEQALKNQAVTEEISFISPISQDAKVLCQGANYRQHMIESGMNPDAKQFNMFFTKSSASISPPYGQIKKPSQVKLLDYEIELCLVLACHTEQSQRINQGNLADYVAGICIGNDVSARDIQIPQMQFHKGKSYRTFCPLGPYLVLLGQDEMHYLEQMNLSLSVNGEERQRDTSANLVHKPATTLTEFSQIVNFEPGDVVMTGTPSGCALSLPAPWLVKLTSLLPDAMKWRLFNKVQLKRRQYLKVGDQLELSIKSSDGYLDLGIQQHQVC